jgi:hypothetical protein
MLPKIYAISNALLHIDFGGEAVCVLPQTKVTFLFYYSLGHYFVRKYSDYKRVSNTQGL